MWLNDLKELQNEMELTASYLTIRRTTSQRTDDKYFL